MPGDFSVHDVQRSGRRIGAVTRPSSVQDALAALHDDHSARPLAGGTDLILDLERGGPGESVNVVDLTAIDGFTEIADAGDHYRLSGGVRHNQVVQHDGLVESCLPLAQACLEVGSPQLRNRATIAGNLATASPANDTISALMALDATVEVSRLASDGADVEVRSVAVSDFFTGFRQTVLKPGDLITAILVPKLKANERGLWVKLGLRRAQAISVVHAGLVVSFDTDVPETTATEANVVSARLAMGSVAPTVVPIPEFSGVLAGRSLTAEAIAEAARAATEAVNPISDGRATADYRVEVISVLIERSLSAIASGLQSSMWPEAPPTLSAPTELATAVHAPNHAVSVDDEITIMLNGAPHTAPHHGRPLLAHVREHLGSTGMKEGCGEGECGACTMLVNGAAVMSCLVLAAQADGAEVQTVEGLDHPIQQAFVDDFAVQCGFCIPGFLMSGARLLDENDDPSDDQIAHALSGNLCRCTGYYPIIEAVHDASVQIRGSRD